MRIPMFLVEAPAPSGLSQQQRCQYFEHARKGELLGIGAHGEAGLEVGRGVVRFEGVHR